VLDTVDWAGAAQDDKKIKKHEAKSHLNTHLLKEKPFTIFPRN